MLLNNRVFRRQLVARQHLPQQDALGQFGHQVVRQIVGAFAGRRVEVFLHGDRPVSRAIGIVALRAPAED
ncbi:hypothetical protein D9M71_739690 [compost metagenome]